MLELCLVGGVMSIVNILIIDDNKDIHNSILRIFNKRTQIESELFGEDNILEPDGTQYNFFSAYQGEEAVEVFKKQIEKNNPIDLVICDMRMPPGMDGKETLVELSQQGTPIKGFICSAYSDYSIEEVIKLLPSESNVDFISKPFLPDEIKDLLKKKVNELNLG